MILILKSPRFLYPEIRKEKDEFTIASRIALGMWDSIPDQALLDAAKSGKLRQPDVVRQQAQRMMNDPRARAKLHDFFLHWIKLDAEGDLMKNVEHFPGFDAALVTDLRFSLDKFVSEILWSKESDYRQLMLADYLWMNDRLAQYYQLSKPQGGGFQQVKVDSTQRCGVITHPYLLSKLAHEDTTSPIHRGVFLTRYVLGGILKQPPEAIAFENHRFDPKLTMREKITEMTKSSNCMTCHETINPLGFTLENFDAVGRYRIEEGGRKIDSHAEYNAIDGDLLPLTGARDVANLAVTSPSARRGFIRQMFQSHVFHFLKSLPLHHELAFPSSIFASPRIICCGIAVFARITFLVRGAEI